jgi:hypothetical protein
MTNDGHRRAAEMLEAVASILSTDDGVKHCFTIETTEMTNMAALILAGKLDAEVLLQKCQTLFKANLSNSAASLPK